MLEQYLKDLFVVAKAGDAREESYYSCLENLLKSWMRKLGKKFIVTTLPKRTEAGNPDFRVWDGKGRIIGYIEAKDPKKYNLEPIEDTEQLKRYRHTFPNVILTNFFEFRLYRKGELINKIEIAKPLIVHRIRVAPPVINQDNFFQLLEQFFAFSTPKTTTAKQLAIELAKRTRFLRDQVIDEELKEEQIEGTQTLESFYKAFKDHLIPSLTIKDFSNLFSQTITYGLFAARSRSEGDFNRKLAHDKIPPTIGILRNVFRFISSTDLPKALEWIVDDIAEVLANTDVGKVIHGFKKEGKGRDPIIHFYETFLAEYDPAEREKRGVYYTPEPVVSYIVRSIHRLLKEKFDRKDGFATNSVTVLDPAAGTLTFPAQAILLAADEYRKKYGEGGIKSLIQDHILKNFYAFELMMAPYAVGHLKIGFVLGELGHHLKEDERFNLYLTNTLDFTKEDPNNLGGIFERTIAKESMDALDVKENIPIMVIIGNPPYSGISENASEIIRIVSKGQSYKSPTGKEKIAVKNIKLKQKTFIGQLIEDYKKIEGVPLGERNPKWIQDDYVKFYRFAQWKIEQNGQGVIGFITNHAWLDNPTFRAMRYSLQKTFDEIYIINLHGSTLKKEKTPEGGKDENVFDIQPGVAMGIFIKKNDTNGKKVFYADRWGLREQKYEWLERSDIKSTKWVKLSPNAPNYFFVPKDERGSEEYDKFWKITDIFPINSVGIVTGRDDFVIDDNKQALETRIRLFRDSKESDDFIKQAYSLKDKLASHWYVKDAREKLRNDKDWEKSFIRILYRPFDEKHIFYHPTLVERSRKNVMQHMLKPNLALLTHKREELKIPYNHFLVTDKISEHGCLSGKTTSYQFPLFIYDLAGQKDLLNSGLTAEDERTSNINPKIFEMLKHIKQSDSESLFYHIYAVLYSNIYRKKYQEFLRIDFPRIPLAGDQQLFKRLAELGKELVDLHLLESKELDKPIAKFNGENGNMVENKKYDEKQKRVSINKTQYFDGIEPEVWNYHIGGYQVLDKWLKDRKGRVLSSEDIKQYCKIITTIAKTIQVQKEIDKLYPQVENNLIEF